MPRLNSRRFTILFSKESAAQNDVDKARASRDTATATLEADKASVVQRQLNLDFTKVTSPDQRQVSRYYLTLGNLVNQDQTLLTTVVSLDPMYAYFDMDEPTLLRIRKAINEGKIKRYGNTGRNPGPHGAARRRRLSAPGNINFVNNQVNPTTGSISVRGVFPESQAAQRASGCCRPACSSASACRSASRTRRCWSSTGPSAPTRG